jgi:osmoprotectant transport system permease protein
LLQALLQRGIDLYPEYLGTIELEILKHPQTSGSLASVNAELAPMGLGAAIPLGFENRYALAVRQKTADELELHSISDLARHPELRIGASQEFIGRGDGWAGLARRYGLPQTPQGIDHGLAYEALAQSQVDVIDIYSTDSKIAKYKLLVLADDLHYFPDYDALVLYRLDVPGRFPKQWAELSTLKDRITPQEMIAMNGAVELEGRTFSEVARDFLAHRTPVTAQTTSLWQKVFGGDFWTLTREHLVLVAISVLGAIAFGVPLGALAAKAPLARGPVLAFVGILQTVPALALLAFLIPILGQIGTLPALCALFVYALLPIVRNTSAGLLGVPGGLRQAALALGLSSWQRLCFIELPLAAQVIVAGVKTAAVISVGTATIAAFIGAGGYGQRITIGLALNNDDMLLAGAIPAALLALIIEIAFEIGDRVLGRKGRSRNTAETV